jgi:peptidoglycan hydrolase-like protein with peptidoglycan-binding domain
MQYSAQVGDSPAIIARRFGVALNSLVNANPHKPTTIVAGQRTWQALLPGEMVIVPVGGLVGAVAPAAPGAPHAQIKQGSTGPDVALWQTIIGVTADGIFGPNTAAKTKLWQSGHGLGADGIVGPKTWSAALGGAFPSPAAALPPAPAMPSIPIPASAPSMPSIPVVAPASVPAAVQALVSVDPCYSGNALMVCAAQTALHVAADGKYGNDTATALRRLVPGAPAGCSPRPSWWAPTGKSNCNAAAAGIPAMIPTPSASQPLPVDLPTSVPSVSVPTAVQGIMSIDPCAEANAMFVCQAQGALGVTADGKYGPASAAAARRLAPGAPGPCSPRPSWWTPTGQSNCHGAAGAPSLPSMPAIPSAPTTTSPGWQDTAPSGVVTPASSGGGPAQPIVAPPEKKSLSTGAMVAGALGVAALVGVVAVAASGKKGAHGARGKRGAARRAPKHKKSKRR